MRKAPGKARKRQSTEPAQRTSIPKISAREKAAAATAEWSSGIDETIPKEGLAFLRSKAIDIDAVSEQIGSALGIYRQNEKHASTQLAPSERKKQALETAEIARDLQERLIHMDPIVSALLASSMRREPTADSSVAGGELAHRLSRFEVHIRFVVANIKEGRRGPRKLSNRDSLLTRIASILSSHVRRAHKIAAEFVMECGIHVPHERTLGRRDRN